MWRTNHEPSNTNRRGSGGVILMGSQLLRHLRLSLADNASALHRSEATPSREGHVALADGARTNVVDVDVDDSFLVFGFRHRSPADSWK
jgi:hypothetical protein